MSMYDEKIVNVKNSLALFMDFKKSAAENDYIVNDPASEDESFISDTEQDQN